MTLDYNGLKYYVWYLINDKSRKFAKTVFFFLRADTINSAKLKITGKPMNDVKRMGLK